MLKSGTRIKSNDDTAILEEADIVLVRPVPTFCSRSMLILGKTTYYEVSKSYPKAIVPPSKVTAQQKDQWWREFYEKASLSQPLTTQNVPQDIIGSQSTPSAYDFLEIEDSRPNRPGYFC
jgi:hypothetical protein